MKNVFQIQQEVATENGFKDWTNLRNSLYGDRIKYDGHWYEVSMRLATESLNALQLKLKLNEKV